MIDIFISYSREDVNRIRPLIHALRDEGFSLFYDRDIRAGERFTDVLETALDEARCVLALWSEASVNSHWVHAEAGAALRKSNVIPVYLDRVRAPIGFHHIQGIDLSEWDGSPHDPQLRQLIAAIRSFLEYGREIAQPVRRTNTVLDYSESLASGTRLIREIKVLFVGAGGAGKTSLIRQLFHRSSEGTWIKRLFAKSFSENQEQTQGIEIARLTHRSPKGDIRVNFWDFGGQEIMHSTHQFFLSQRSIYVLVLDGRRGEDAENWLQMIQTYGGKSPVLLALNKIDENPGFEVNRKFLSEKYPAVACFHRTSCKTGAGITAFAEELFSTIERSENVEAQWPAAWYEVKQQLESLTENFISYDRYESICRDSGVSDEDQMESLASLLHDLGTIVHFDSPVLRETNVVNPTWITSAVYRILTSRALAEGGGMIQRDQLSDILDLKTHPKARHDYIVEVMRRFELCFPLKGGSILIPDLLRVSGPTTQFDRHDCLRYRIVYEFLPTAIFPRLLLQLSSDVDARLAWRDGAILQDDTFGASALVTVDRNAKLLDVFVTGKERREYFSIVRKALLDISLRPTALNFKETVPCICIDCQAKKAPYFYDYSYLLQRKRKGKDTVDCQISVETVSIKALLEGIETSPSAAAGWDVFVSYSSGDAAIVSDIVGDLEGQQIRVWWDSVQIRPGDSITRQIEIGLRTSRYIMPCLSRNQLKSGWCRAEYAGVMHKILGGHTAQRVTPLIIDDLPDQDVPYLFSDFRSERLSNSRGYKHLLAYIAGRDSTASTAR